MKAIIYNSYGNQEKYQWTETAIPTAIENQILVKVKASSINPVDWKIRKGEMKLFMNKKFPKGLGVDFAGTVENIGNGVTKFKKGDEVFGWLPYNMAGSAGEYVLATEELTAKKPANIGFAEAATLPMACIASIVALINNGKVMPGMKVLINGCTGGVGQFAVMIAKIKSAKVTGTCNASSVETAKKIGVDVVMDYTKTDILKCATKFDVIFDTVGNLNLSDCKSIMSKNSIFLELNPTPINLIFGSIKNLFSSKKIKSIISKATNEQLQQMQKWVQDGKLKPVIGKQYAFEDALEAYINLENGEKNLGKTVIIHN
jgi:NADPH:quinone reductase-like Zn-dependent oxidoreductase